MVRQFLVLLSRYIRPYRHFVIWSVLLNILYQFLNVFSFATIVPILNVLFQIDTTKYDYIDWTWATLSKDILINNAYYYVQLLIDQHGAFFTLLMMGVALVVMTGLKTAGYFLSASVMVPLRTGIVRDIRVQVYDKVLRLPLSFFSEERKGDIIARMSADVQMVETALTSSLDMLIRNPIAIVVCFATLFLVSWELTLFVFTVLPLAGWIMGSVSRKLKRQSAEVQTFWGDIVAQLEETLGGLRIVKAFLAEDRMRNRFLHTNNHYRQATNRMATRQASAHPMSEFLGTCIIVIVLTFGGWLILNHRSSIDAPVFIFYMVILYSIINPLKDLSKAWYAIPQGMACMERIDFILQAENPIKDPEKALALTSFDQGIEFRNVSFSYTDNRPVLQEINLCVPKGKTIALVGQSGSGKSTLVDLVPRYHDVSSGEILMDGKNIKDVTIHSLRTLIGNVNQEAILFNDTF
ncbi:MAG: ABC transporter ATP-binding protein, partial [Bacteroidaceae bacterium]|nr:ABC transporter ATP-binding protein [Bacteroidaceae bacterium]